MSDTSTRTIPITKPGTDQVGSAAAPGTEGNLPAGPGWLARHKVEVLATGAALAVTAAGVKTRDTVLKWSADHPRATLGAGVAVGATTGATLTTLSGVAVEPLVIKTTDGVVGAVGRAAEAAKGVMQDSRPLTLAGGTLAGAAAGVVVGMLLSRQAPGNQAEQSGDPQAAGGETRVPGGWLARLRFWADHHTDEDQAEPEEDQAM